MPVCVNLSKSSTYLRMFCSLLLNTVNSSRRNIIYFKNRHLGNKNRAKMLDDSEEKTRFVTIAVGSMACGGRGVADGRKNWDCTL